MCEWKKKERRKNYTRGSVENLIISPRSLSLLLERTEKEVFQLKTISLAYSKYRFTRSGGDLHLKIAAVFPAFSFLFLSVSLSPSHTHHLIYSSIYPFCVCWWDWCSCLMLGLWRRLTANCCLCSHLCFIILLVFFSFSLFPHLSFFFLSLSPTFSLSLSRLVSLLPLPSHSVENTVLMAFLVASSTTKLWRSFILELVR